jgi:Spore coat polysaccharide biosynthesis protein F, CMP-KDO synthetase homolog
MQARMGSMRLPGKVLLKIIGKSVLELDVARLRRVKNIDEIVIATTLSEKDDLIVEEAKRLNISYFRGDEEDVLSRYHQAAKGSHADVIVRITSDCPLIDSDVTESIIGFYLENIVKYDYVSNTIDRTFPRGLDTEVFSYEALNQAYEESTHQRDREHVTPYIWDNKEIFSVAQYLNDIDYSNLRWTLDTKEDFELIQKIYEHFYERDYFSMHDILELLKEQPYLSDINKTIKQKTLFN